MQHFVALQSAFNKNELTLLRRSAHPCLPVIAILVLMWIFMISIFYILYISSQQSTLAFSDQYYQRVLSNTYLHVCAVGNVCVHLVVVVVIVIVVPGKT